MKKRILIIEDDLLLSKVLCMALEKYELRCVNNYDEVEQVLREFTPDIVISDFDVGSDKTAMDVYEYIKELDISFLLLSGKKIEQLSKIPIFTKEIFDTVLAKPISNDELNAVVSQFA